MRLAVASRGNAAANADSTRSPAVGEHERDGLPVRRLRGAGRRPLGGLFRCRPFRRDEPPVHLGGEPVQPRPAVGGHGLAGKRWPQPHELARGLQLQGRVEQLDALPVGGVPEDRDRRDAPAPRGVHHPPAAQRRRRPAEQAGLAGAVGIAQGDAQRTDLVAAGVGGGQQRGVDTVAGHQLDGLGGVGLRLGVGGSSLGLGEQLADGGELVDTHRTSPDSNTCSHSGGGLPRGPDSSVQPLVAGPGTPDGAARGRVASAMTHQPRSPAPDRRRLTGRPSRP